MGFAVDPATQDVTRGPFAKLYDTLYAETFDYVADKLGASVISIEPEHEVILAPQDITVVAGVIPKGTVAAATWRWRGKLSNGITMVHTIIWTSSHDLHGETDGGHWKIEIDGRPSVRVTMDLLEREPNVPQARASIDATAAVLIRSIPAVVDAAAGFYDLPAVLPYRDDL